MPYTLKSIRGEQSQYLCTLEASRRLYPRLGNHKPETVYRHLCGELPYNVHRHRALDDAKLAARVWMEIIKDC